MEVEITKLDSVCMVKIDGCHIENVSYYKLNTVLHGNSELTLVINIPTDVADIIVGEKTTKCTLPDSGASPSNESA